MDAVGGGDMNLGELADLTVANDNDLSMDVSCTFAVPFESGSCVLNTLNRRVPSDAGQQGRVQEDVEPSLHTTQPL